MSETGALVSYRRSGGSAPSDDERLDILPDGRFEARRTVGERRIGRFAGSLEADAPGRLAAQVKEAAAAGDLAVPTPRDGATVSILVDGAELRTGSNEPVEGPWGELRGTLEALLGGEVLAAPVAAVELEATSGHAVLRHVGSEALDVDTSSVAVRAVRLDARGAILGRWQGSLAPPQVEDAAPAAAAPAWVAAEPGWELDLPFRHGLELTRDDWLQVWVTLAIRDGGEHRSCRLFRAVSGGEG